MEQRLLPRRATREMAQREIPKTPAGSIDVRAGGSQVIVAILKSGDWAGLQLAVAHPCLLELGTTLGQAQRLLEDHRALQVKLKEREADVCHLLEGVDAEAGSEGGTTQTSDALGQSFRLAWVQLSTLMHSRQALLRQAVDFFQTADEFSDNIEQAKQLLEKCQRSEDVGELKDYLAQHELIQKVLAAASARVTSQCAALVEELQAFRHRCPSIASESCYRRGLRRGRMRLETLMEMLQERCNHLEPQLEQQRAELSVAVPIYCWDQEMDKMTQWFRDHGERYLQMEDVGSCLQENETLLELYEDFNNKAKEVAEEVQSLLHQAEEMMAREGFSEEQAVSQRAQGIRSLCQEFWRLMAQRRTTLHQAHAFFCAANEASDALARLETQVELIKSSSKGLAAQAKEQQDISNAIRDVIAEATDKGTHFLAAADGMSGGMEGAHRALGDVKRRAQRLEAACTAPMELCLQRQRLLCLLQELLEKVTGSLQTKYEPVLKSKCDVLSSEYENILDEHVHLMDLSKDIAGGVEQITDLITQLRQLEAPDMEALEEKVARLRERWTCMYADLQERTETIRAYVTFLNSAKEIGEYSKSMEDFFKAELTNVGGHEERAMLMEQGNAKWRTILNAMASSRDLGSGFITAVALVAPSTQMPVKNMVTVVESATEELMKKKLQLIELWMSFHVTLDWARSVHQNYLKELQEMIQKTISKLKKVEDLFVPLSSVDLEQDREAVVRLVLALRQARPNFQGISADVEYLEMTRNLLATCGSHCEEAEAGISDLMALHCRARHQINESQRVLEMAAKLHQVTDELDRLDWSKELDQSWSSACSSHDITHAQTLLTHWQEKRTRVMNLCGLALSLIADIITASWTVTCAAREENLSSAADVLAERCTEWSRKGLAVERKFQMNLNLCATREELKEFTESYRDLKRKFNNLRFNYMKKPEKSRKAKAAINQVQQVEMYMEKLPAFKLRWQRFQEKLTDTLNNWSEACTMKPQGIQANERDLAADVNEVEGREGNLGASGELVGQECSAPGGEVGEWNQKSTEILLNWAKELKADTVELNKDVSELERVVEEYRCNLELTIQLQDAMKDSIFWCEETVSTIARVRTFSSECKTREGMAMLGRQFDLFLWPTVPEQEERMHLIEDLALRVYGPEESKKYIEKTRTQHDEIMTSIRKTSNEIRELEEKLLTKGKEIKEHSENPASEANPSTVGHALRETVADIKENNFKKRPSEDETSRQSDLFSGLKDPLEISANRMSGQDEKQSVKLSSENASTSSLLGSNSKYDGEDSPKEEGQKEHHLKNGKSCTSAVYPESGRSKLLDGQACSSSKAALASRAHGSPEARTSRSEKAIEDGHCTQEWQKNDNGMARRRAQMHDGSGIERPVSSSRTVDHCVCEYEPVFSRDFECTSHICGYARSRSVESHAQAEAPARAAGPFAMDNGQVALNLGVRAAPSSIDFGKDSRATNFKCPYFSFVKLVTFNKIPVGPCGPLLPAVPEASPRPALGSTRGYDGCSERGLVREETQLALTPRSWCQLAGQPSRFTQPLASAEFIEGSPVTVEVTVGGSPEPTVVWLRNGQLLNSNQNTELGCCEDRHCLLIVKATVTDAGVYIARAENVAGAEATAVVLQVNSGNEWSDLQRSAALCVT
ncbi:LOW QUALITY PROTEIN: coiled-coil domain-containing protein 141 [Lethenteron reissneri]|uniref:LOW QUALITY PROTEIN: coiled-coil domain-containing protein 141 n=1 Tax=Lethenteron reissneri TaxID=7753 RepID=UPI002AB60EC2|nr:LOW QUALITY PROTEIN: coiled-coil domain-containing protein 141 [Lethenteron reissneri]